MLKKLLQLALIVPALTFSVVPSTANALVSTVVKGGAKVLGAIEHALTDDAIGNLAKKINVKGDLGIVGDEIAQIVKTLPEQARRPFLEDTWARIAVARGSLSAKEADDTVAALRGVDGFATALRTLSSTNSKGLHGYLSEIRVAHAAKKLGMNVTAIGRKVPEPNKTDIDVEFIAGSRRIFTECKNVSAENMNGSFLINIRDKLDKLVAISASQKPEAAVVLWIAREPSNPAISKILRHEAEKRNVSLIIGDETEAAIQIKQLAEIL